jgi:Cysteinyl-tRNA synthetase
MTISTFLLRSVFYSNPSVKPIARWIKTKWTRLRQVHGWTGGNGSTPFLILKLRLTSAIPTEVAQLAQQRENARREKNWKRSDELRERISALGWEVRDTKDGPKLTRGAGSA